jgi:hypothetical protein
VRPFASSIIAGACGATAVTSIHELGRKQVYGAPRMDVVGERALTRALRAARIRPPRGERLRNATLVAELISNTLWYSLLGLGRGERPVRRGLLLGLVAGVGGVMLTPKLGLGRAPVRRAARTPWLTIVWYTLGGITAGVALRALRSRTRLPA